MTTTFITTPIDRFFPFCIEPGEGKLPIKMYYNPTQEVVKCSIANDLSIFKYLEIDMGTFTSANPQLTADVARKIAEKYFPLMCPPEAAVLEQIIINELSKDVCEALHRPAPTYSTYGKRYDGFIHGFPRYVFKLWQEWRTCLEVSRFKTTIRPIEDAVFSTLLEKQEALPDIANFCHESGLNSLYNRLNHHLNKNR